MPDRKIDCLRSHSCDTKKEILVTCLDEDGNVNPAIVNNVIAIRNRTYNIVCYMPV